MGMVDLARWPLQMCTQQATGLSFDAVSENAGASGFGYELVHVVQEALNKPSSVADRYLQGPSHTELKAEGRGQECIVDIW